MFNDICGWYAKVCYSFCVSRLKSPGAVNCGDYLQQFWFMINWSKICYNFLWLFPLTYRTSSMVSDGGRYKPPCMDKNPFQCLTLLFKTILYLQRRESATLWVILQFLVNFTLFWLFLVVECSRVLPYLEMTYVWFICSWHCFISFPSGTLILANRNNGRTFWKGKFVIFDLC